MKRPVHLVIRPDNISFARLQPVSGTLVLFKHSDILYFNLVKSCRRRILMLILMFFKWDDALNILSLVAYTNIRLHLYNDK